MMLYGKSIQTFSLLDRVDGSNRMYVRGMQMIDKDICRLAGRLIIPKKLDETYMEGGFND